MVGMLDQMMMGYRAPGGGWNQGAFPPVQGAEPTIEEIIRAMAPAMIGSNPMSSTGSMGAPGPAGSLMGAQPFERGTMPMVAPGIGMMSQLPGMPRQAPVSGEPAVTSLDGGPIPLPRPDPRRGDYDMSSRGPVQQPAGDPMSLAPPSPTPSSPPGAPAMNPAAAGGGFRMPSSAFLLALGGGLAGAPSFGQAMKRGFTQAAGVAASDDLRREQRDLLAQSQGDIYRALKAKNVPDAEIMAGLRSPTILKELADKYLGTPAQEKNPVTKDFKNPDGSTIVKQWDAKTQTWNPVPGFDKPVPRDTREVDKVDANVAARLGLAESFLNQLPSIRKRVAAGEATGPIDAISGALNMGAPGELRRQVASGAEALLRNLTGAGMAKDEAARYVKRYEIEPTDKAETVMSKLNQLERELSYTVRAVYRGRGGIPKVLEGKLQFDEDAGNQPAATVGTKPLLGGKTRGGMAWSVVRDDEE